MTFAARSGRDSEGYLMNDSDRPESHPSRRPAKLLGAYVIIAFIVALMLGYIVIRDNQHGKADATVAPKSGT
jgi:hypothetical protein